TRDAGDCRRRRCATAWRGDDTALLQRRPLRDLDAAHERVGAAAVRLEDGGFALTDIEPVLAECVEDVRLVGDDQRIRPRLGNARGHRTQGLHAAGILVRTQDLPALGYDMCCFLDIAGY